MTKEYRYVEPTSIQRLIEFSVTNGIGFDDFGGRVDYDNLTDEENLRKHLWDLDLGVKVTRLALKESGFPKRVYLRGYKS